MRILVDTGVLLRAFDRSDARQRTIFKALRKLWSQGAELVTAAQNVAEFWNVSTRPSTARGGLGLGVALVHQRVQVIERLGDVLPFSMAAYQQWRMIVIAHQVIGVAVHDARLVATMKSHGIHAYSDVEWRRFSALSGCHRPLAGKHFAFLTRLARSRFALAR